MKLEQGWAFECGMCKQRGEPYPSKEDAAKGLIAHMDRCSSIYADNIGTVRDELKKSLEQNWTAREEVDRLRVVVRSLEAQIKDQAFQTALRQP